MGDRPDVIAGRWVAGVFGAVAAAVWVFIVWTMLSSAYSTDPASDPHGYGLIFGALAYLPFGIAWALAVPLALPKQQRARSLRASLLLFVAASVLLALALYLS